MVPPRSFARTTTTAARILFTILLRASLRIRPNSQSISQFSYLFQYPEHLSSPAEFSSVHPPISATSRKCYSGLEAYRAESTAPRSMTATEIPSAACLLSLNPHRCCTKSAPRHTRSRPKASRHPNRRNLRPQDSPVLRRRRAEGVDPPARSTTSSTAPSPVVVRSAPQRHTCHRRRSPLDLAAQPPGTPLTVSPVASQRCICSTSTPPSPIAVSGFATSRPTAESRR
jgi:hypothetical protein